jgi:hypothetical protein
MIQLMQTPEELLLEENSLLQRGLDPEMVDNLKLDQINNRKLGIDQTLEQTFYFEVDDTSILDDQLENEEESEEPQKTLAQVYQQAASALTLQDLENSSTKR